jgi:hypothetical protein
VIADCPGISIFPAHKSEEIDTRRGSARRVICTLPGDPRPHRRDHVAFHGITVGFALPQGIKNGSEPRFLHVAAEALSMSALTGFKVDDGARNSRLAEIEGSAITAGAPAQHDKTCLGRLCLAPLQAGPMGMNGLAQLGRFGAGQCPDDRCTRWCMGVMLVHGTALCQRCMTTA